MSREETSSVPDAAFNELSPLVRQAAGAIACGDVAYIPSCNVLQALTLDGMDVSLTWMKQHDNVNYNHLQQSLKWHAYKQLGE